MASSGRARNLQTASRPSRGPTALPPYEPPTNKLNDAAQRALHSLPNTHRLDGLHTRLKTANAVLSNSAAEINDRFQQKSAAHQKRWAKRRAAQGTEEDNEVDNEDDIAMEAMRQSVDDVTNQIEESVRRIIDARAAVGGVEAVLKELDANITAGGGAVAPTQSTLGASQFRQKRQKGGHAPEDEDSELEGEESQVLSDGPSLLLKSKIADHNAVYEALSMKNRYASNNDYIGFRKIIHDARNPKDDAPPMPNASTWFPESHDTADPMVMDVKGQLGADVDDNDDDDEITIASERKSLKCPLTLCTMQDPISSKKCPHSFERSAIMGLLAVSEVTIGGNSRRGGKKGGERAMICPECNVLLSASDLQSDPVLIRRIKRLQAAERMQQEEDEDEENSDEEERGNSTLPPRGTQQQQQQHEIGSDDETDHKPQMGTARHRSSIPRAKAEKLANSIRDRQVSMVPNSQVQAPGREDERPASTAQTDIVDLEESEMDEDE